MAALDDLRAKFPDLQGLDDNEAVDALHQAYYADLPREQVAASLGVKPKEVKAPARTWGQAAADTGRSVMSGLAGVAKEGGDLYGLASGDMQNPVSTAAKDAQEYWTDGQSEQLKAKIAARKAAIDANDSMLGKFATAIKETVPDPALMVDMMASNVALMVPGMAAGRLVQGAMMVRALAASGGVLSEAAALAVARSAAKVATGVAVGIGAVQQGADVASQAFDDSIKKTAEQLAQNPEFVARVQRGEAPRDVAMALGLSAARAAFLPAAAISVAGRAIPGGTMLERALIGGAARDTIQAGAKYALPKAMLKAGLGEAAQETIEEGGGQFAANVAKQRIVDPNQDLSEGIGENAGMGAAGGLGMGVAGGAMHRQHGTHAPTGDALREELQPDTGPLARGANAGIRVAAAEADNAPPPPPASPPPTPDQAAAMLAHANARAAAIDEKAKGTKDEKTKDADGKPRTIPGKQPEFLTPEEKAERDFLKEHGGDAAALATVYAPTAAPAAPMTAPSGVPNPAAMARSGVQPVDTEAALSRIEQQGERDTKAQREFSPTQARAAPALGLPETAPAAEAPKADDKPASLAGDILNWKQAPFKERAAALRAQKMQPDPAAVVLASVEGGYVLRPVAKQADASTTPVGSTSAAAEPAAAQQEDMSAPTAEAPANAAPEPRTALEPRANDPQSLPNRTSNEPNPEAGTRATSEAAPQAADAPSPAPAPAEPQPAGLPVAGSAKVEPAGVEPERFYSMGRYGDSFTAPEAVARLRELDAQANSMRKQANGAPTKFMQGVNDESASMAASLARKLRRDIAEHPSVQALLAAPAATVPAEVGPAVEHVADKTESPQVKEIAVARRKRLAAEKKAADTAPADTTAAPEVMESVTPGPVNELASEPTPKPTKPHAPFANNYAAFDGRTVEQKVNVAGTGEIATLRMDAAKTMREFDQREQALRGLQDCLKKAA